MTSTTTSMSTGIHVSERIPSTMTSTFPRGASTEATPRLFVTADVPPQMNPQPWISTFRPGQGAPPGRRTTTVSIPFRRMSSRSGDWSRMFPSVRASANRSGSRAGREADRSPQPELGRRSASSCTRCRDACAPRWMDRVAFSPAEGPIAARTSKPANRTLRRGHLAVVAVGLSILQA